MTTIDYSLVAGVVGYCAAHFLAYVVLVRDTRWGRSERGIFLYHAGSFLLVFVSALSAAGLSVGSMPAAIVVSAVAVHGIYSLSFLEVWSLTQGSYSLSILDAVETAERNNADLPWERLLAIEADKRKDRITGLRRMGLVATDGSRVRLTSIGRVFVTILALISWTVREDGGTS